MERLYFRVIERQDGSWACHHDHHDIDHHADKNDALSHVAALWVRARLARFPRM